MPLTEKPAPSGLGFTLAELTVMVVILGLLLSLTLPRLFDLTETERLRTSARLLAGQALEAHSQAAASSRPWFLCLDLTRKRSWLDTARPGSETESAPVPRYLSLPSGVSFKDAIHPGLGLVRTGRLAFGFWPQGGGEPGAIHLTTEDGQDLTIFLRPYLGRTEIKDGYLREETR
ncbi:MAG: hypothetical protein AB1641_05595 [Thermodesulfobacteriota bacterium]